MSWQDRDKLDLKITTGDGQQFTVFWLISKQKIKWHGADKSYIQLSDSNVEKRQRQGRTFPMEFYFQGDDHLDDVARFSTSLDDKNPIVIEHPYYNTIICQILEIDYDNSQLNITRVTCTAMETMVGYEAVISNPKDIVLLQKIELDDLLSQQPEIYPSITELNTLKDTTKKVKKLGMNVIGIPDQAQEYINSFNTASSYVNTFLQTPILAMEALNGFLTLPSKFLSGVENRVRVLKDQFDILRGTVSGLLRPQSKLLYEAQQIALISTMCQASVLPLPGDYTNAMAAVRVSKIINDAFDAFKTDLDSIQSINNGSPLSFVPTFDLYSKLNQIVYTTTSSLYEIALSGRKQRQYILPEDSCLILLTHQLMRLDPDDNNLQDMIQNNNLTHKQIALGIEKGTTINYFI